MSPLANPPVSRLRAAMPMLSPFLNGNWIAPGAAVAVPLSGTWSATNRMFFYPINVPVPYLVTRFWWLNGATVGTNNIQMALYASDGTDGRPGTRLILGTSTLSAGSANSIQFDNITDTQIAAGRYWICIWGSGTTMTVFRTTTGNLALPIYTQTDAGGPPSAPSPDTNPAAAFYVMCGITNRASP